jgi:hypothetical protein
MNFFSDVTEQELQIVILGYSREEKKILKAWIAKCALYGEYKIVVLNAFQLNEKYASSY